MRWREVRRPLPPLTPPYKGGEQRDAGSSITNVEDDRGGKAEMTEGGRCLRGFGPARRVPAVSNRLIFSNQAYLYQNGGY